MVDFTITKSVDAYPYAPIPFGIGANAIPDNGYSEPITAMVTFSGSVGTGSTIRTKEYGTTCSFFLANVWKIIGTRAQVNSALAELTMIAGSTVSSVTGAVDIRNSSNTLIGNGTITITAGTMVSFTDIPLPTLTSPPASQAYTPNTTYTPNVGTFTADGKMLDIKVEMLDINGAAYTGAGTFNTINAASVSSTINSNVHEYVGSSFGGKLFLDNFKITGANPYVGDFKLKTTVSNGNSNVSAETILYSATFSASNLTQSLSIGINTTFGSASEVTIGGDRAATYTATMTVSDPLACVLTTGTSGAVTSTYNSGTGVWTASGAKDNVKALLNAADIVMATDYDKNFTISMVIAKSGSANQTGTWSATVSTGSKAWGSVGDLVPSNVAVGWLFGSNYALTDTWVAGFAGGAATDYLDIWRVNNGTPTWLQQLSFTSPTALGSDGKGLFLYGNQMLVSMSNGGVRRYDYNGTDGFALTRTCGGAEFTDNVDYDGTNIIASYTAYQNASYTNCGRVYIYNATTGATSQTIDAPTPATNRKFGTDVIIRGNTAFVTDNIGTLYVYTYTSSWGLSQTITLPNSAIGTRIEYSDVTNSLYVFHISGSYIDVYEYTKPASSWVITGSTYIFRKTTVSTKVSVWGRRIGIADTFYRKSVNTGNWVAVDYQFSTCAQLYGDYAIAADTTNNGNRGRLAFYKYA